MKYIKYMKCINLKKIARYILIAVISYSVIFSLVCTYGMLRAYSYGKTILRDVRALENTQPAQSAFMKNLQKTSPKLEIKQTFVPLDSISPHLQKAVVSGEDASFYFHPGFDIRAIVEALEMNQKRNKIVFGASTLTQQLAKNMFLTTERSWERKFKEITYAILMEKYLGKNRILELYLNYAQWGQSIFGCEAAAQNYYKKSCASLSLDQSVNLAAMLASPGNHHPEMKDNRFMRDRRNVIYRNMFPPKDSLLVDSLKSLTAPVPKDSVDMEQ
ncbi:MAG: monofunctional biosynthetic peptidoglycan transglycosylase [Fibromonadaceae bacterium]|jgi:monofunctional biosynthetic peptidoglycan transglycosylase|nr:monofunctional biosynthetic peptidoglycan transglycosylase [Fibromonadaceae bacterium]